MAATNSSRRNPSTLNSRGLIVAFAITALHVAAIYALLSLRDRTPAAAQQVPVAVRFIAESPVRPRWQPPPVTPVAPTVKTPEPTAPVIEIPVAQESSQAISVPVMTAVVPAPAEPQGAAKLVASVEYLRAPDPRYPPQSRKLREQGLVVLRVTIDERGVACDVAIENSSGHERLDHAAREAIARAEFRPYVEDGVPRRALVLIPIEFSLTRGPARIAANGA